MAGISMTVSEDGVPLEQGSPCVGTFSGKLVNLITPGRETIDIEDIAHALAQLCRFGGHTRFFYSVAEHCCHAHDLCRVNGPEAALAALLHDAHEAYLGDWTRPLQCALPHRVAEELRRIRQSVDISIRQAFDSDVHWWGRNDCHEADRLLLAAEARKLMIESEAWKLGPGTLIELPCWEPEVAEGQFLRRFRIAQKLIQDSGTKAGQGE